MLKCSVYTNYYFSLFYYIKGKRFKSLQGKTTDRMAKSAAIRTYLFNFSPISGVAAIIATNTIAELRGVYTDTSIMERIIICTMEPIFEFMVVIAA